MMDEKQPEEHLSTADLAEGAERRNDGQEERPEHGERRESPIRPQAASEIQTTETEPVPLLDSSEVDNFRSRWNAIQTGFVDEPRSAVEDADTLVAEVMKRIAQIFAGERAKLEDQWNRGDEISTEDLRITLQCYRSFFDRLLAL